MPIHLKAIRGLRFCASWLYLWMLSHFCFWNVGSRRGKKLIAEKKLLVVIQNFDPYPRIPTTIKTMGVNITTIVYLRVLIIEIGSTIIFTVVEAQGLCLFRNAGHISKRQVISMNRPLHPTRWRLVFVKLGFQWLVRIIGL